MVLSARPRLLLLAVALLLIPFAGAQGPGAGSGEDDLQGRPLHILEYHPYPDTQAGAQGYGVDPFGIPGGEVNGTRVGYMEAQYDAYWYPTTVIDGIHKFEGGPKDSSILFDMYASAFEARRDVDSPVVMSMMGAVHEESANATYEVALSVKPGVDAVELELRLVLYEDEVTYSGGNGVDLHRFTVRAIVRNETFPVTPAGPTNVVGHMPLPDSWNAKHLGLVASLHNRDPSTTRFDRDEVVQAATFRYGQGGATVQYSKGVLLETLTATWCPACVQGDGVVNEMANTWGVPSSSYLAREWAYLRPIEAGAITLGVLAAGIVAFAAWTSQRKGASPP